MSDFLGELETFPDLEVSIIRITKIHKVLKAMIKLPSIPLDEVFHIRTRCVKLLAKWHEILSNDYDSRTGATGDKEDEPKPEGEASAAALTTNGEASKDVEEPAEQAEVTGDAPTPEEESEGKLENMIGTTVEGDQEDEDSEQIKTTEEEKTDGPAIESAPGGEYKPPV